jgi:hypothetical protein
MFPNPITAYEVKLMEQRELMAAVTERRRHMTTAAPSRGSLPIVGKVRQILSAALDRIVMLLPDSRDGLRSKEQELAAVGVAWSSDSAHDEMLARQIEAARLRRRVGYPAAQSVPPPATSGLLPKGSLAPQPPVVPARA